MLQKKPKAKAKKKNLLAFSMLPDWEGEQGDRIWLMLSEDSIEAISQAAKRWNSKLSLVVCLLVEKKCMERGYDEVKKVSEEKGRELGDLHFPHLFGKEKRKVCYRITQYRKKELLEFAESRNESMSNIIEGAVKSGGLFSSSTKKIVKELAQRKKSEELNGTRRTEPGKSKLAAA